MIAFGMLIAMLSKRDK
ncbi:hypothetical protein MOE68_12375 [Bacillus haynesii]|nr:hypothetical protein [Bacillus haynesii]MCY9181337.1 hypothetical protein [Bacillus haynesii]